MTAKPDPVLVHDYLLVMRGAERTLAVVDDCWPQAPVRTLLYDQGAGAEVQAVGRPVPAAGAVG